MADGPAQTPFTVTVLGSGSSGNATLVSDGEALVLIDGGFSGKEIARRMERRGFDPHQLSAVLVTHEHSDHIKSVHTLSNRYKIPLLCTEGTFAAALQEKKFFDWQQLFSGRSLQIGRMTFHPITLPHDAADPVGFRVECDGRRLAHMTDFGYISGPVLESLRDCHTLIVEANHDPAMLMDGPYPWFLKQRIAGRHGHLSNDALFEALPDVLHDDVQHVVFAHMSQENNHPAKVKALMKQTLRRLGLNKIPYQIAPQDDPLETLIV